MKTPNGRMVGCSTAVARSSAQRRRRCPHVTLHQPVPTAYAAARPSSSSTASSGETGLTGSPVPAPARRSPAGADGSPSASGRSRRPLAERSGVEHEVVGRPVEAHGQPAEDLAQRFGGGRDVGRRRSPEVRVVTAGHDPDLERRARGVRRERDTVGRPPRRAAPVGATPRGRGGSTGTRPRGSRNAQPRRAPRRCGAGSVAGRTGRGTGGWSARRPARPSSGPPAGSRSGRRAGLGQGAPGAGTRPTMMSLPTAWRARCSSGGATMVRQLPLARAWASATWASRCGRARGRRRRSRPRGTRNP